MNLLLKRFEFGDHWTIGRLFADDQFLCYTREPVKDLAIPKGVYPVIMDFSAKYQSTTPLVTNVPLSSSADRFVRMLSGDSDPDESGNIFLGRFWPGNNTVHGGRVAVALVMAHMYDAGQSAILHVKEE